MSVLSDLFHDIAYAIREKTGGTATFPPVDFPKEIRNIVVGGSSGGDDGEELRFAEGSFGNILTPMTERQTLTHGLGEVPDCIIVLPLVAAAELNTQTEVFAVGFHSKVPLEYKSFVGTQKAYALDDGSTGGNMSTAMYVRGMDETTSTDRAKGVISTPDENTFQVGGSTAYSLFGMYRWIAISGMGGTAGGGSNSDVCYVTFMSHDGTVELGKKAVAVGDDCADPINRGIFSTPTKESDAQYNYSFVGWATEPNGAWDEDALKEVKQDRTLYAAYASAVRYYTVTYYDSDGTTVLHTESKQYGSVPSYKPTHEELIFESWNPEPTAVTGDASYIAVWTDKPSFAESSWEKIAEISESGKAAEVFSIGDERIITIKENGDKGAVYYHDCKIKIVGFNHDEKEDGSKAGITCLFFTLFGRRGAGSGTISSHPTYVTGNHYKFAKQFADTSYWLPADLRAVIKPVKKEHNTAGSTEIHTEYLGSWIPSLTELGFQDSECSYQKVKLGSRYEMFSERAYASAVYNTSYGSVQVETHYISNSKLKTGTLNMHITRGMATEQVAFIKGGQKSTFGTMYDWPETSLTGLNYCSIGFCI